MLQDFLSRRTFLQKTPFARGNFTNASWVLDRSERRRPASLMNSAEKTACFRTRHRTRARRERVKRSGRSSTSSERESSPI